MFYCETLRYLKFGAFLITELAVFCSVIWRKTIWKDDEKLWFMGQNAGCNRPALLII